MYPKDITKTWTQTRYYSKNRKQYVSEGIMKLGHKQAITLRTIIKMCLKDITKTWTQLNYYFKNDY